jgi:hypothetical protein
LPYIYLDVGYTHLMLFMTDSILENVTINYYVIGINAYNVCRDERGHLGPLLFNF